MLNLNKILKYFVFLALLFYFVIALPIIPSLKKAPVMTNFFDSSPFEISQRDAMKRQHLILTQKLSTKPTKKVKKANPKPKNIWGGLSQHGYIPKINRRQVRIFDLSHLTGEKKLEMMRNLTKIINSSVPIYEDREKVQKLELALLEKGVWAVCKWEFPLPPPLNKDEQCTQSELKFLLQRSVILTVL